MQISPGQYRFRFSHVRGEFNTSKMAFACRLHWWKAQQRVIGGYPSIPHPEATWLSLSLYVSDTLWTAVHLLQTRVSSWEQVNLRMGPLRSHLDIQPPSVSPRWSESPLIFPAKFCGYSSFWHWNPGPGSPGVGLGSLDPPGGWRSLWSRDIPPNGCGMSSFYVFKPSTSLDVASSLYPQLYEFCSPSFQIVL